jgi:N-formylglutamate deformylase
LNSTFHLQPAERPLLVSVPHAGTDLPESLLQRLRPVAHALPDTDWWIDQVWSGAPGLGAGFLVARLSRYVVDLNRPPDDVPLYAGAGTGLVPVETFSGEPLYLQGDQPGDEETAARLKQYWQPYHAALAEELERIREVHGFAILLDAHSIRSEVPRLFDGRLPDLNLGSHSGASAARGLVDRAQAELQGWHGCSNVLDGRFTGGYITRHYGQPERNIHALQFEMAQSVYMQEDPPALPAEPLARTREKAVAFMRCLMSWNPDDD